MAGKAKWNPGPFAVELEFPSLRTEHPESRASEEQGAGFPQVLGTLSGAGGMPAAAASAARSARLAARPDCLPSRSPPAPGRSPLSGSGSAGVFTLIPGRPIEPFRQGMRCGRSAKPRQRERRVAQGHRSSFPVPTPSHGRAAERVSLGFPVTDTRAATRLECARFSRPSRGIHKYLSCEGQFASRPGARMLSEVSVPQESATR